MVDALLQVVNRHVFEFDLLRTIDVGSVGENANRHAGTRNIGEPDEGVRSIRLKDMIGMG